MEHLRSQGIKKLNNDILEVDNDKIKSKVKSVKGLERTKRIMSGQATDDVDDEATKPKEAAVAASDVDKVETGASNKALASTLKRSAEFSLADLKPRSLFQLSDVDNASDMSESATPRSCQSAGINVHHC